ncbi:MAG: sulfate transporter CysZ [Nitrospiria bacterium]
MKHPPFAGAGYLLRGATLITKPGIRPFVIIPLLINTLLFATLLAYGAGQFGQFIDTLLPAWLSWLEWLLWPLFAVTISVVVFFTFVHVGHFIGAPFNGLLAERVEQHIKGTTAKDPFRFSHFLATLMPAFLSECRKIIYFIMRAGPLLLLFFIPVVNVAASLVWMVFSAWMLSLEYLDYPMANHHILFSEQRRVLRAKKGLTLGFGGAALVLLMIPILNFFVMPIAVAGATAMWIEQFEQR